MFCEWRRHFGWLVTGICHLQFIFGFGAISSYVLLYVELEKEFEDATAMALGWVAAVAWGLSALMSVVTSPLYERFGHQKIITTGVFLTFLGILGTTFAPNLGVMYLTFGVGLGGGFNFVYNPTINLVTAYFPKINCTRATALATMGAPVGLLVTLPLLDMGFHHVGWRNSYRVFAGIYLLVSLPLCYFMMPPGPTYLQQISEAGKDSSPENEKFINNGAKSISRGDVKGSGNDHDDDKKERYKSNICYAIESINEHSKPDYLDNQPKDDKDHIPELDKFITPQNQQSSDVDSKDVESGTKTKEKYTQDWQKYIALMWLPQHWFFFFAIMGATLAAIFNAISLGDLLINYGFDEDRATFLISGNTIAEILTRLLIATFGDCLPCSRTLILPFICTMAGIVSLLLGLYNDFVVVIAYLAGAGIARGVIFSFSYGVAVEVFGAEKSVEIYTSVLVAFGLGGLLGSTIPGLSFDLTGSYTASLHICAGIWFICAVLYIATYITYRKHLCDPATASPSEDTVGRIDVVTTSEGYKELLDENSMMKRINSARVTTV